jgi:transposase
MLWKGELESVWMPDQRCRVLRRRLARREQLVHARTRAKNEIHAVLQRRLQVKPPSSDLFGVKGRQWLAGLELPLEERESVDAALRHVEFMDWEIREVERLIAQEALSWPEIRRLMTVPGSTYLCRDPHGRDRQRQPIHDQPQTRGLSRVRSEGPPIRRGPGAQRPDLKARLGIGALGAGRGRVEHGQAARSNACLLPANPRTARPRQSDRR